MAPEMFTLANYDESVDMWAIGIYYFIIIRYYYLWVTVWVVTLQSWIYNGNLRINNEL